MTCDEFELLLNATLDERRRPEWDERLRDHARHCPACHDLAAGYATLFEGFAALATPEPSADLPQLVLAALQGQTTVEPASHWNRKWFAGRDGLGIAAGLFSAAAAVLVAFFLTTGDAPQQPVLVRAPQPAPAVVAAKPVELPNLDLAKLEQIPLVGPAMVSASENDPQTDPYAQLAKDAGRGLAQIVLVLPGVAGPSGVRPPAPGAGNGSGLWPAQMTEELRPVTETVSETFNLLLDALPLSVWSNNKSRAS